MNTLAKQEGFSFGGFIIILIVIVVIAIFSMKMIPSYLENAKIQKTFEAIVSDPSMQTASLSEIKESFYKRAVTMDNVTAVNVNDIDISKENGKLYLSINYSAKIHMVGNVSLLIEFNPSAPK